MEGFRVIGLSYKTAPIEVRETVTLAGEETSEFILKLKDTFGAEDVLVVSTCNRTEIYYSAKKPVEDEVIRLLASFKGLSASELKSYFQVLDIQKAIEHLFRVSLGLESKVLGDIQISNQVKRAYQLSADLGVAGPFLHRLMHTIFYANKRVVQETSLQDGMASVASVATDLIERFVSNIEQPRVALIGLGEIGQDALENLNKEGKTITLLNRTKAKAEKLANNTNIQVRDFSDLVDVVQENDVVITAVSTKTPIINQTELSEGIIHKLFIDLSVPRSINTEIDSIPGVALYNVDQLSERTEQARDRREQAIPDAEAIIKDAMSGFDNWRNEMEVSPTINKLKKALDKIRQEELARYSKASDEEQKLLEVATKNMIQKVIKLPVLQLKAACKRGEAETLVGVLNDLFNLEQEEIEKK